MGVSPAQLRPRSVALPFCALVTALFTWTAFLTFDAGDWPSPNGYPHNAPAANACGVAGAWVAYQLRYYLGDGAHPLLLFATLAALMKLTRGGIGQFWERAFGLLLLVGCTAASSHLITARWVAAIPVGHGGLLGFALGRLLTDHLDSVGTIMVLVSSLVVGLLFTTEGWVLTVPSLLVRVGQASGKVAVRATAAATAAIPRPASVMPGVSREESAALLSPRRARSAPRNEEAAVEEPRSGAASEVSAVAEEPEPAAKRAGPARGDSAEEPSKPAALEVPSPPPSAVAEPSIAADRAKPPAVARPTGGPKVNFPMPPRAARVEPYPRQIENWRLPSLELLQDPEYGFTAQQEMVVREQARVLERTLEEFRIDARVVEIDTGPVITMFELKLGAGIKVSQIATLSNDIARALKSHAIRVVAPISGKNTIGIEVPNTQKEKVRLKELMSLAGRSAAAMALPLFMGKDASGAALVADLAKMPHLLIAGTTGSGKSVCINSLILSLLMTKRPDHVKMILVDPKMVEMSQFKEIPHLMCPIVTDMPRAEKILEWAVTKMDERYEILAEARVKNIEGYNNLGAEELYARFKPESDEEKAQIAVFLPYIVIIIDELADLMMTSAKEVEHHLSRLAQKSRAVGIHIIVATQRPEAKVVTGLIKSNLPCRIAFRVASRMDSRIVLDQNGGEVLMGQGDMLFLPPGSHKLVRAQGTFLEDTEVHAVLEDLGSRAKPEFHPELVQLRTADAEADAGMRDPLFDEAVRIILESKRGSVSLLQRRLTIGYSRASRLIDQMALAGIVGEYKGSQAREVLLTLPEWEAMRADMSADLQAGYAADEEVADRGPGDDPWEGEVPALSDDHDIRG
ncbi:MAG: DNA translocase FtsK 4TM domain-containing protein [Planctomycetes bacterium]|nr:DNA translocase FtsK 4TM domain-containing protein [Planctomycetota bacterium]